MARHEPRHNSFARRLLLILLATTFVLLGLHLLFQAVNLGVYHQQHGQFYELSNRFDFDDEASVPTWFAQFLYLLIAAAAGLAAYLQTGKQRRLWTVISLSALLFSIDEIAGLHEYVLQTLHVIFFKDAAPGAFANAWLVIAPFLLALAAGFIYLMARSVPRRTLVFFAAATGTFLFGAVAVDIVASQVYRETFLNQGLVVGLEETFELLSLVIVAYAIADYTESEFGHNIRRAFREARQ